MADSALFDAQAFGDWPSVAALAANDFERVVPGLHTGVASWLPLLRGAAQQFAANGVPAIGQLSGSGATCFLLGAEANGLALPPSLEGARVISTRTATAAAIVGPEHVA